VKQKVFFSLIALILVALVAVPLFGACAKPAPPAKDKIVIGQAVSLSGPNAIIHASGGLPPQTLWIEEVNANGGIYVKEYGKKLPIEWIQYDDKSEQGTMTRLMEKLIIEDKVDFLLAPSSTSWLFAAAPIANKYGYILLGAEGGAESLEPLVDDFPYVFLVLNYSNTQIPLLAEQFKEWGIKTVAMTFLEDLHGVEYSNRALTEFLPRGIEVILIKSHPAGVKDMSPVLKEAQASGADAFCSFSYPGENVLIVAQSIEIGYNPKAFFESVGPFALWFGDIFGRNTLEGLLGGGAWNAKQSPAAKDLYDRIIDRFGEQGIDMWGNLYYWGSLQFFEQAIEKAGTLDQKKIRDIMATEKFDTALGPTWFDEKQRLAKECHPGEIGQWQKGEWEVVLPADKATATPIYPKPAWPTK